MQLSFAASHSTGVIAKHTSLEVLYKNLDNDMTYNYIVVHPGDHLTTFTSMSCSSVCPHVLHWHGLLTHGT